MSITISFPLPWGFPDIYPTVSAALELSNKTMFSGSLKLVWAIFQALFIVCCPFATQNHLADISQGFVQTLGSDFWLRLDSSARAQRLGMMESITKITYSDGLLAANWTSESQVAEPISLALTQTLDPTISYTAYNYVASGCFRGADWPWWLQGLKWQWTLPLIPTFALLLALWNLQAVRKWNDVKHVVIMVIFGCASYAGESPRLMKGILFTDYSSFQAIW